MLISPSPLPPPLTSLPAPALSVANHGATPEDSDFMTVLLGTLTRNLQKTADCFSPGEGKGTASLFDSALCRELLGQYLAEQLAEQFRQDERSPNYLRTIPERGTARQPIETLL